MKCKYCEIELSELQKEEDCYLNPNNKSLNKEDEIKNTWEQFFIEYGKYSEQKTKENPNLVLVSMFDFAMENYNPPTKKINQNE